MKLGDRMKGYEGVTRTRLTPRMPAIIRIDGKAFHTWTKGLNRPFDLAMATSMGLTMSDLVHNIQGAVFGYTQSDEISILLKDYASLDTEAWFGGNVQKIVSVAASMATAYFNRTNLLLPSKVRERFPAQPALFDARVFVLPREEVVNYFVWRQQDFQRNSVQMLAYHILGHKACQGLNRQQMIDAIAAKVAEVGEDPKAGIMEYDALATNWRHGVCYWRDNGNRADHAPPLFAQDRAYIERFI